MSKGTPSQAEWIGNVPSNWRATRLKAVFRDISDVISQEDLARLEVDHYSIPSFDSFAHPTREDGATIASSKTLLRGGEILYSKLNCHKPRVWLVSRDENVKVASTEFIPLAEWHDNSVDKRFVCYLLGSSVFAKYMSCFQMSVTNSHKRINPADFWQTRIPFPPLAEQKRIASYLDASSAAIDAAVTAKRRQLGVLGAHRAAVLTKAVIRGLHSDVQLQVAEQDWLGEIPKHWSAVSLKRLLRELLTYGLNEAAELDDRDLPRYVRITDFDETGALRDDTFRSLPREIARDALLAPGDVLFARSGATVGKTFIFRDYPGEACFAGYLVRARTIPSKLDPEFLYLFTKTLAYEAWKNLIFTQATIQNISAAKYNYLTVPVPPLPEQNEIVRCVRAKEAEFQQLATRIRAQVTTLVAYRKSLIHECVTGQRRITDADLKRVAA